MPRPLVLALRSELARAENREKAQGMQRYMKSVMPYRGVPATPLREICKRVFAAHPLADADAWHKTILELWRQATYREERYAAIELSGQRTYRAYQTLDTLPLYEELIVSGAWWDYVDAVAIHRVGPLLASYRKPMTRTMLAWSKSPDLWKRRSSIICQVAAKDATDTELLYATIERNVADRDFFIRKAIGWALRAYAWIDPDEVARYVRAHESELSPLSRREALKNVEKRPSPSAAARRSARR